jgi:uroporphyrinogen III methyltransferase / synthase
VTPARATDNYKDTVFRPLVYIIGAGPGDPGLITARGLQCLALADVVIFDHLVPQRLLRHARPEAERIDVGLAAPQPLAQEAICYLIAEKARERKIVARLKWGDPFVFGRGGEEALFLHEQGVPFEIVPGVPAGIASATYAGVPVTYPGGGDTLVFVRGYEDDGRKPANVDWASLARLEGTIVCYAGAKQLPAILHNLLSHGRPADESAVLVYDGTLPTQTTIEGTLGELAAAARQPNHRHRPAILVVGNVAGFRQHLRWFDARPLFGKRVLVTRPREQAAPLVDLLESLGAEAIEAPLVRILPPEDSGPLDAAAAQAGSFDWIVFSSANAVDRFMERLLAGPGDLRDLKGVKLCAVGPMTAERLSRYGIKIDLVPSEHRAEGVVDALGHELLQGARVLLPRSDIGRELIAEELRRAGADVTEVVAYRAVVAEAEREGEPDVYRMLLDGAIDVVTFTSASAVKNFVTVFGADAAADLLKMTLVASIGPVTAEAAERLGIRTAIVPSQFTIAAMVDAIVDHFAAQAPA